MEVNVNITDTGAYSVSQKKLPQYINTSIHITYFQTIRLFQILLVVCDDVRGGGNTV